MEKLNKMQRARASPPQYCPPTDLPPREGAAGDSRRKHLVLGVDPLVWGVSFCRYCNKGKKAILQYRHKIFTVCSESLSTKLALLHRKLTEE